MNEDADANIFLPLPDDNRAEAKGDASVSGKKTSTAARLARRKGLADRREVELHQATTER